MEMACYESGMKNSKLQDGESDTRKRINKILKQVTKLQEKKSATNKRTARINMILELVCKLQEDESEEDEKLESMRKLEEEKKLEAKEKKLEEEQKKLEAKEQKLDEEKKLEAKLEEEKKLEAKEKKLEEEQKKLEEEKKLEEREKRKMEMGKVRRKRKSKLSEEEIELKKRIDKMLGPDWKPMTMKAKEIINKLSEKNKYFGRLVKPIDSIYNDVIYNHLHSYSYPPETVQSMNNLANLAIDVFNQTQPIIKYSVVDVVRVTRLLIPGYIVHVLFTAKPDDGEGPVTSFDANLRYFCGRAQEVTYVDIEYIPSTST